MVDRVLAELTEHRGRVVLVIDDAHELASTEALAQLTRLLGNLPPQASAAHLAVATSHAETTPPDRQRRLRMAIAALRLWLAGRRAHLDGVVEQTGFLASPVSGRYAEEITLGNDLRAAALMNLGTVEAWSLALTDAERHLREGAAAGSATSARRTKRPNGR